MHTYPERNIPQLYLIGGPNGAGKTTSALRLLRQELTGVEFVNADLIAQDISPTSVESAAMQAGRLMLQRLHALASSRSDLVFESTLASRSFAPFCRNCRTSGYTFHLLYFWLLSPELAVERVAARVRDGGHSVPAEDIRRRYHHSMINLRQLYLPLANRWVAYDNSGPAPLMIAERTLEGATSVYNSQLLALLLEREIYD